jgi:hypothetical protein
MLGTAGVAAASLLALASPVQAADPVPCAPANQKVSVTNLVNRPDGGLNGIWANLTYTRTVTLCEAPNTDGGDSDYYVDVHDVGTFTTLAAKSPGSAAPGVDIPAGVTGTFVGGFTTAFEAPAGYSTFSDIHNGQTYTGAPGGSNPTTGGWVASLFTAPINGPSLDGNSWSWKYEKCLETWINQATAKGGNSGDILGVACPPPATTSSSSSMPDTGASVSGLVVAGSGAVVIGALLVGFAALRRARGQH